MEIGFATLIGVEPMPFPELVRRAAGARPDGARGQRRAGLPARSTGPPSPATSTLPAIVRDGPRADPGAAGRARRRDRLAGADAQPADRRPGAARGADRRLPADDRRLRASSASRTLVTFTGSAFGMHFCGHARASATDHPSNRTGDNLRIFAEVYGPLAAYAEEQGRPDRLRDGRPRRAGGQPRPLARISGTGCSTPCPRRRSVSASTRRTWSGCTSRTRPTSSAPTAPASTTSTARTREILPARLAAPGHPRQRLVALPPARSRRARLAGDLLGPARRRLRRRRSPSRTRTRSVPGWPASSGRPTICAAPAAAGRGPMRTACRRADVDSARPHSTDGRASGKRDAAMSRKVRTGLIGCGKIAPIHAMALNALAEAEFVACCDVDERGARAHRRAARRPARLHRRRGVAARAARSTPSASARRTPATPRSSSPRPRRGSTSSARNRSRSGWPKPTGWSRRPSKAGIKFGVIFQRRFWPAAQRIREAIDAGTLGN